MSEIKVDFNKHEQLYNTYVDMQDKAATLAENFTAAVEQLNLAYQSGNAKDKILASEITRFELKARDLLALAEVTAALVRETHEAMIDADRMLAVKILNSYLNDAETPPDQAIVDACEANPETVIALVTDQINGSVE